MTKITMTTDQVDRLIDFHYDIPDYDCMTDYQDEFPQIVQVTGVVEMGKLLKAEKFELTEPNTPYLLNWLCHGKVIEPGEYEIVES